MSLKDEYSFGEFCDLFRMNSDYEDSFTYDGLQTLFDMADMYGYDYDAAAICGDFEEYDDAREAGNHFGIDMSGYDEQYDWDEEIVDDINRLSDIDAQLSSGYTVVVYNPYGQ